MLQELSYFFKLISKRREENLLFLAGDSSMEKTSVKKEIIDFLKKYHKNWDVFFDSVYQSLINQYEKELKFDNNMVYLPAIEQYFYFQSKNDRTIFSSTVKPTNLQTTKRASSINIYERNNFVLENANKDQGQIFLKIFYQILIDKSLLTEIPDYSAEMIGKYTEQLPVLFEGLKKDKKINSFVDVNPDNYYKVISDIIDNIMLNGMSFREEYKYGNFPDDLSFNEEQKKMVYFSIMSHCAFEKFKGVMDNNEVALSYCEKQATEINYLIEVDFTNHFNKFNSHLKQKKYEITKNQLNLWFENIEPSARYLIDFIKKENIDFFEECDVFSIPTFLLNKIPLFSGEEKELFKLCLKIIKEEYDQDTNRVLLKLIEEKTGDLSKRKIKEYITRNDVYATSLVFILSHNISVMEISELIIMRKKFFSEKFEDVLSKEDFEIFKKENESFNDISSLINAVYLNDKLVVEYQSTKDKTFKYAINLKTSFNVTEEDLFVKIYNDFINKEKDIENSHLVKLIHKFGSSFLFDFNIKEFVTNIKNMNYIKYIQKNNTEFNSELLLTKLIMNNKEQCAIKIISLLEKEGLLQKYIDKNYLNQHQIYIYPDEEHQSLSQDLKASTEDVKDRIFKITPFSIALTSLCSQQFIDFIANKTLVSKNNEISGGVIFSYMNEGPEYLDLDPSLKNDAKKLTNRLYYAFKKYGVSFDSTSELLIKYTDINNRTRNMAKEMFSLSQEEFFVYYKEREVRNAIKEMDVEKIKKLKVECGLTLDYSRQELDQYREILKKANVNKHKHKGVLSDGIIDWIFVQEDLDFGQFKANPITNIEILLSIFLNTEEDKKRICTVNSRYGSFLNYIYMASSVPNNFSEYIKLAVCKNSEIEPEKRDVMLDINSEESIKAIKIPYIKDSIFKDIIQAEKHIIEKEMQTTNFKKIKRL